MREIDELQQAWQEAAHLPGLFANLSLEKDGLVLGAGTILARRNDDGALDLAGEEQRILTLLSVAYGLPIDASILGAFRRASKHARAGDVPMAAMHIALAGLPKLPDPSDAARRIFIADGLLAKGVRPRDIFAALEFDPAPLNRLEKFDPDELRNPKGSGRISGEWTREIEAAEVDVEEAAEYLVPRLASRIMLPIAVLGELVSSSPTGGTNFEGPVAGHPLLRYVWNDEDYSLHVIRESDGQTLLSATLGPDGKLRVGPKIIGRKKGDEIEIDPFNLPADWPEPDDSDDRRLCPKESFNRPYRPGVKGERDQDVEDWMKRWVNPENPTPRGMGYAFYNPLTGKIIIFDDCQRRTGYLFDAKGRMYARMLSSTSGRLRDSVAKKLIAEATNQVAASEGRKIYWCFAEPEAAHLVEALFAEKPGLDSIRFCHLPLED